MKNDIKALVDVSKYLFERKLVSGKAGNISSRFKNDEIEIIAITPTMISLGNLKEEDVVLVDIDGNSLTKGTPSSEVNLHLNIYKKRKDVNGIVHTHSPFATGFSFSNKKIKRLEGFGKIKNPYLIDVEYKKPGSDDLAISVAKALADEDVLILKKHGVLSTGSNIEEACLLAEFVEDMAKTQFISNMLRL
ncbi:L-fuculose phosphate aldolase [Methanobrevibacter cuticularis]|uniref:L-fuculose phosphate aldolase n=1 Tax=Methanobrevibacter cuticularis TaxID=47311 RepID=A0A166CIC3_9EURY|nr:class II aldolase/adducin family protein [Methanobrevibacter cuticularis]KZX14617.1 L-fuculose phosphate aldolase [Methanobrevibacter cuticularis]